MANEIMPLQFQPIDPRFTKTLDTSERKPMTARHIKSQRIGERFDIIYNQDKRKISFATRMGWKCRRFKDWYYNKKHMIRNHVKWRKTLYQLRPWDGHGGLILLMQTHLRDYITCEEKYGIAEETYKQQKLETARETVALLERMKDPSEYLRKWQEEVKARYPNYQYLISEYEHGGTSYSGDFIAQGNGWVGIESGEDPHEGYFEFLDGKFERVESPSRRETDRLLNEIKAYRREITAAYEQAEVDSKQDFERLHELLSENLYAWWD